jgi:hypothetical protein
MDQLDLFSRPVEPLRRRGKSSAGLGVAGKATSQPTDLQMSRRDAKPTAPTAEQPAAAEQAGDDPLPSPDLTPRQVLEQWLRKQAIPYVNADNIKTGLPTRNGLHLFDFVVHREEASWLLAACHDNPSDRLVSDLREWERILGPGFAAVVARVDDDGGMTLRAIDGEHVDLG